MSKSLPATPNLEHLRKQAKELLAAIRADDAAAVSLFQQHLPRLASAAPANVSSGFKLSDAQLVLAREYGFPSWPKLKSHVEAISEKQAKGARTIVEVQVCEVYEVHRKEGEAHDTVVVLKALDQERYLPIWIATPQGINIVLSLRGLKLGRPQTSAFIAQLIERLGGQVESVHISSFQKNIYHAALRLLIGGTVEEIDCRPSDALSLAVENNAPIFVAPDVLDNNGCDEATAFVPQRIIKPLELPVVA